MTSYFHLNGRLWHICFVLPSDPMLLDRTNNQTLGTTDIRTNTVYLSSNLHGEELAKVLIHEMGHCALHSFGLIDEIHRVVYPEYWIEAEEWICNFIFDYGLSIFKSFYQVMGISALNYIPREIEKIVA